MYAIDFPTYTSTRSDDGEEERNDRPTELLGKVVGDVLRGHEQAELSGELALPVRLEWVMSVMWVVDVDARKVNLKYQNHTPTYPKRT